MASKKKAWFFISFLLLTVFISITFLILFIYFTRNPSEENTIFSTGGSKAQNGLKRTLVYSYGGNDLFAKELAQLFQEANQGVEVKLQQLPGSTDYQHNLYKLALSSGDDSIDVFNADIIWTAEFASSGFVLNLDGYFKNSKLDRFLPNSLEGCFYDNRLFAIPNRTDVPVLFYRKDIVSTPPKTFSELIDLSIKYKSYSDIKYGYVCQSQIYEGMVCNVLEFILNNGGRILEGDNVVLNSPEAIEGLQFYIDLVNSRATSHDIFNFVEDDSRIAFQDGSAVFMRNWLSNYKQINEPDTKVSGKTGIAPLPVGPHGNASFGTLGGWNYMINANSKNIGLSYKFIEFASKYDIKLIDATKTGYLPALRSIYDSKEIQKINPDVKDYDSIFSQTFLRPVSANYSFITKSMQQNFNAAAKMKITAKEAIENIEKDMNYYLKKLR